MENIIVPVRINKAGFIALPESIIDDFSLLTLFTFFKRMD